MVSLLFHYGCVVTRPEFEREMTGGGSSSGNRQIFGAALLKQFVAGERGTARQLLDDRGLEVLDRELWIAVSAAEGLMRRSGRPLQAKGGLAR